MKRLIKPFVAVMVAAIVMSSMAFTVCADDLIDINATNFPDEKFRNQIWNIDHYDGNNDGKLSPTEIGEIYSLTIDKEAKNVTGIEYLTELTYVAFPQGSIESANLYNNSKLETIVASNTTLRFLTLPKENSALKTLKVSNSNLVWIKNFSEQTNLRYVDISGCTNLYTKTTEKAIDCRKIPGLLNLFKEGVCTTTTSKYSFSMSKGGVYYYFACSPDDYVFLADFDTSICTDENLYNFINQNYNTYRASILELNEVINVKSINCKNKDIKTINGLDWFFNLESLNCSENDITSITLTNGRLKTLLCYDNDLEKLDVTKLKKLEYLDCSNNKLLYSLDVSNLIFLKDLICFNGCLDDLYLGTNSSLTVLDCSDNELVNLSLSGNPKLETLYCTGNELTSLNLSGLTNLTELYVTDNHLTEIDLNSCSSLYAVEVNENEIKTIDCSACSDLEYLDCSGNKLTNLVLPTVRDSLMSLYCNNNQLTSLDVSNSPILYDVSCENNKLTSLNVSNCPNLIDIYCQNNQLKALDLSTLKAVGRVLCQGNSITDLSLNAESPVAKCTKFFEEKDGTYRFSDNGYSGTHNIKVAESDYLKYTLYYLVTDEIVAVDGITSAPAAKPTPTPSASGSTGGAASGSTGGSTPVGVDTKKVEGFAERLYTKCLNRASDPNGKAHWVSQLKAGVSGADVAKQFFYSPEFIGFKLDDKEYVTRLYRTFMDREPDQTGMDFWLSKLAEGKGRDYVFYGFVNSTEWANICLEYGIISGGTAKPTISRDPSPETIAFATRLYTTCMCRPADAAGVDYWAKELSNMRRSGTQVAYEFFFSKEFIDYGVSDDEYINRLYQTFMGRAADSAGFAYWQGELKNSDRKTILYRFAGCQEFADICSAAGIIR